MAKATAKGRAGKGGAAQGPAAGAAKPAGSGGLPLKAAVLIAVLSAPVTLPFYLLLLPGMMPTIAISLIDRPPRYLTYTIGAMNFAGIFPFLVVLAEHDLSLAGAAAKLAEPLTWIVMYGAAAAGWLINAATPFLARSVVELQAFQRRRTLESLAKAMREEWGGEVAESDGK